MLDPKVFQSWYKTTYKQVNSESLLKEITGILASSDTDVCMYFRITRLSAHANDTIVDTVEVLGAVFNFTSNKLGTAL